MSTGGGRSNLTVLLVDDHDGFRRAARAELEAGGLTVVAELDMAARAVEQAIELRPDVALLDIRLPDGDGLDLAERISEAAPETAVVLTSGLDVEDVHERLSAEESHAPFLPKRELSASALRSIIGK